MSFAYEFSKESHAPRVKSSLRDPFNCVTVSLLQSCVYYDARVFRHVGRIPKDANRAEANLVALD